MIRQSYRKGITINFKKGPQGPFFLSYFFIFLLGGWAPSPRAGCDKLSQRHYVTLTQHIAVRGYVTLTSGARVGARG